MALATPVLIAKSTFGAYYFFTFSTLLCTVVIAFFMKETRGHSLEAIEQQYNESHSAASGVRPDQAFRMRRVNRAQIGANQTADGA